jgi:hypothetical protein
VLRCHRQVSLTDSLVRGVGVTAVRPEGTLQHLGRSRRRSRGRRWSKRRRGRKRESRR